MAGPTEILRDGTILSVRKVKADIQKSLLDFLTDKPLIVYFIYRIGLFKTVSSSGLKLEEAHIFLPKSYSCNFAITYLFPLSQSPVNLFFLF